MRALLSVYDKTGWLSWPRAFGRSASSWWPAAHCRALAEAASTTARWPTSRARPRCSGQGQDAAPEDPRWHPGRPLEARAPCRRGDNGIDLIDLVVCNLYPSRRTLRRVDRRRGPDHGARRGQELRPCRRAGSTGRLWGRLEELGRDGQLSDATRLGLARALRPHGGLRRAIVEWLDSIGQGVGTAEEDGADDGLPETIHLTLERAQSLRYGENPHQRGARYG